jgi:cyclopropane-fatty-acyl-phospholipid synthase
MWLDRDYMQYTCAYYPTEDTTLERAQVAKLDLVCRKLDLKPGDTVVEAGSGWGGLARYIARHYGATVRSYNISAEQVAYAREQAEREGLGNAVEFVQDDYRNISGSYDVFVSVGMLEHVGLGNYASLGAVIDRCLKENGRGLVHSIGRNIPRRMNEWIESYIFPGAYPPTLKEMMDIFEPFEFVIMDVENLRSHYARTLTDWLARYEQHVDRVREMFDENFVQAWRLYLSGSISAFTGGQLQLFQVLFQRHGGNSLPVTRERMLLGGAGG